MSSERSVGHVEAEAVLGRGAPLSRDLAKVGLETWRRLGLKGACRSQLPEKGWPTEMRRETS